MSKCRTLGIIEQEAFQNLHFLFLPNSSAHIFYNQNVATKANTLDKAFSHLKSRLTSNERRERMLEQRNYLKHSNFRSKAGADNHSALNNLCLSAKNIRLQLGLLTKAKTTCAMP